MAEPTRPAHQADDERPPTLLQLILFSFPALPHAFVALPVNIIIPGYYAANAAVTLSQIAYVTTISRLADAITDPLIGYLSDRTKSRLGRRKPWVIAGTIFCAISIYFLFQPPKDATFVYYAIWSFGLYLGFTLFEIPRNAWATELTREYVARAKVSTWVSIFNVAGSLIFWAVPIFLILLGGTGEIDATALSVIAVLYVLLMPLGIFLASAFVGNGPNLNERLTTIREIWDSVRLNKPLWIYNGAYAAWGIGQGAFLSVIFIFLTDYMKLGDKFPILMIAYFAIQIGALPIWQKIIARIGKHRAWAIGLTIDVLLRPTILLFEPGGDAFIPMLALTCVMAFFGAPSNIIPVAVLGDVIDYDLMKRRVNNAGNFFALNVLIVKATMAIGAGFALKMLDEVGYRVGQVNDVGANNGLLFTYLVFPAIMMFITVAVAWQFPITREKHAIIRRRIEQRAAREKARQATAGTSLAAPSLSGEARLASPAS